MRKLVKSFFILTMVTSSLALAEGFSDFYSSLSPSLVSGMAKDTSYWQTIFAASTPEMIKARAMVTAKGDAWNDRETRIQLFRGRWLSLLTFAMRSLPEEDKAAAGTAIAEDVCQFLTEIGAFGEDKDSEKTLWGYAESFEFLFSPEGELKLEAPAACAPMMARAFKSIEDYHFFEELSRLIKQAEEEDGR